MRSAGYDVARSGTDRSVRSLLYGTTLADLAIVKDKTQQLDTGVQADWLVTDAPMSGYGLERLAVDAVGLGVGVVDGLAKQGFKAREFMSGAKPDPEVKLTDEDNIPLTFDNLRSQMIYLYARGIELGIIKHFVSCPYLKELQKEAMVHNYDTTDKVLKVESKDKVKARLGASPDLLDAVVMGLYVALRREKVTFRVHRPARPPRQRRRGTVESDPGPLPRDRRGRETCGRLRPHDQGPVRRPGQSHRVDGRRGPRHSGAAFLHGRASP